MNNQKTKKRVLKKGVEKVLTLIRKYVIINM